MTGDGVRARCAAVHAAYKESTDEGRSAELRLLEDIVQFTIRRDAGYACDEGGESLEVLYGAFLHGLARRPA